MSVTEWEERDYRDFRSYRGSLGDNLTLLDPPIGSGNTRKFQKEDGQIVAVSPGSDLATRLEKTRKAWLAEATASRIIASIPAGPPS